MMKTGKREDLGHFKLLTASQIGSSVILSIYWQLCSVIFCYVYIFSCVCCFLCVVFFSACLLLFILFCVNQNDKL